MKHNYHELSIWKRSIELVLSIYNSTKNFPAEEKFGLQSQIQRAAVSIPSNIAEGCGRDTNAQISHFINIALGSLCEVETQLIIAKRLKYINQSKSEILIEEINQLQKMTRTFIKTLKLNPKPI